MTNDAVLPDGRYLGIGLRHQLPQLLKGPDAAVGRVLSALGLSWNVRVFYHDVSSRACLQCGQMYFDVIHTIMRRSGAQIDLPDSTEHPVQLAEVTDLEDNISEVQLWCHVR